MIEIYCGCLYVDSEKEILVNHHKIYAFGPAMLDETLFLLCHSSVALGSGGECTCFVWLLLVKQSFVEVHQTLPVGLL